MSAATRWALVLGLGGLSVLACERDQGADDPSGLGQPIGYDQYGNPIYQQQPGYPQPGYPQPYQQPPGYGQPAPQGTTSQPSGLALPCQSDVTCGTHKCNIQVGRCAFPCQAAQTDCAAGLACAAGFCVPGGTPP